MIKKTRYFFVWLLCVTVIFCVVPATVYAEKEPETNITDGVVVSDNNSSEDVSNPSENDIQVSMDTFIDPFHNGMKYSSVIYTNTNGLPTSEANAITQTKEGFIWIGSYGGLVRYDGNTFECISLDGITGVKSLYTDSKNRLWIGATNNGFAMMENENIRYWNENNSFVSDGVDAFSEDVNGTVYIATNDGMIFVDNNINVNPLDDERLNGKYVCDLEQGTDGFVYGLDEDGYVFTLMDGKIHQYGYSSVEEPFCLLPDYEHSGYVRICGQYSLKHCYFDKNNSEKMVLYNSYTNIFPYTRDMQYIDGMIWYCSGTGIYAGKPENYRICDTLMDVPFYNSISHVMRDYQGNFWFTSSRQGVMKIVPNYFDNLYQKYLYSDDTVNSTCLYNDILLVATDTGLSLINENSARSEYIGILHDYDLFTEVMDTRVRSVISDNQNRLWVSTWGKGLFCLDKKKVYHYDKSTGLSSDRIRTVRETKNGSVLIIGEGGLDIMKNRKIIKSFGKDKGLENTDLLCVEEGLDDDILLGSDGDGIYIIDKDGIVENIGKKDGLSSTAVMCIKKDRTRDIFWIVTGDSIAYMTKDHKITIVTNFPYQNNFDVYQNSKDEMWVLSSNGIYVVPTEQMLENKAITPVHYGIENGLTRTATANSFSELTESGNLYMSGNTGVTKINIETAFQDTPEIKAAIPFIDADGKRLYPDENGKFNISSYVKKLTVYSYVFNYSLTTPQISYCLEGFDDRYITVSRKNLMPVDYTNLKGGDYRFILKVFGDNREEYITVTADIIKEKAFYEQVWFYIVIVILNLLAISVIAQLIWVSRMRKLRQKHKEEVEKERIDTELEMARKIQTGTMPAVFPPFPDRQEFDIYASVDPAKEVGGDFYDFFMIDDDNLCLVIADVSGKGVPAALFMMSAKIIISGFAEAGKTPAEILTAVNEKLRANNPEKMFVTVWLGILEISTGKLTATNAGHEYPVLMQPDGKFEILKDKHEPMICFMKKLRYKEYQIELKPGARLFLYTDGIPEATNSNEQMFGINRLLNALNENPDAPLKKLLENVRNAVDGFVKEAEQFDDLTMLCLEYKNDTFNTDNIDHSIFDKQNCKTQKQS